MKKHLFYVLVILIGIAPLNSCNKKNNSAKKTEKEASIDGSEESSEITTPDEPKENTDSQNWDELLDNYEEYTDSYIKLYKKAMNGDQTALTEYPALLEKTNQLQESMVQAQNDNQLSAKQLARLTNIQNKMVQAISK